MFFFVTDALFVAELDALVETLSKKGEAHEAMLAKIATELSSPKKMTMDPALTEETKKLLTFAPVPFFPFAPFADALRPVSQRRPVRRRRPYQGLPRPAHERSTSLTDPLTWCSLPKPFRPLQQVQRMFKEVRHRTVSPVDHRSVADSRDPFTGWTTTRRKERLATPHFGAPCRTLPIFVRRFAIR